MMSNKKVVAGLVLALGVEAPRLKMQQKRLQRQPKPKQ